MNSKQSNNESGNKYLYLILGFSLFELLIHLYCNAFANYGIFRDELYYVACSNHLAAGYVDQPPLSAFILFISIKIFGDSVFALRLLPAIAAALTVFFTGLITRRIGGGYFGIFLTCLTLAFAPQFLGTGTIYSMNIFDWFFWILSVYLVTLIVDSDNSGKSTNKLWILLGIVLGLGMLNKIDVLWFGAGLFVGLIFTSHRRQLKTIYPYLAGIIAFIIFSPYIIWNIQHNFATLEFIHRASTIKYASQNPGTMIKDLILSFNPVALLVWFAGIIYLFFNTRGKKYRIIGLIFLTAFVILIINWHSKTEFIAPAMPLLIAAGGGMIEKLIKRIGFGWIRFALPGLILLSGIAFIPFALPVLPPQNFISYSKALGMQPSTQEGDTNLMLPQFYADMFGWENMAAAVSKVYTALPPDEQKRAFVFGQNYGEAGAIDFFRKKYPLPPACSGQNNYWYWGLKDTTLNITLIIGGKKEDHLKACFTVDSVSVIKCKYARSFENNLGIFIGRNLRLPFYVIWLNNRFFI